MKGSNRRSNERKTESGRNLSIELLRFLFAFVVVMVHTHGLRPENPESYPFVGGYVAVEFFLILSGYFVVKSAMETNVEPDHCGKAALKLTWKKFCSLFFYVFFSVILQYSVEAIVRQESLYTTAKNFMCSIFEISLLPMSGIYQTFFVSPLWYLSSLFLILPLFQYFLLRFRDFTASIFLTLVPLVIYGHFSVVYGELDKWNIWYGFFYVGTLRVLAGLSVGGLCFFGVSALKKLNFTKAASFLITFFQILLLGAVLSICYGKAHSRADFILVVMISLFLILTLSEQSALHKVVRFRVCSFLGKLSVPLFISHWAVRRLVPYLMPEASYGEMLPVYLLASMMLAVFLLLLKTWLDKWQMGDRVKRYFIR